MDEGLQSFAFDGQHQDIDRFRNEPFWRGRLCDLNGEQRFRWTAFHSAIAARLLDY
jgi:5-methylcytosine-specific restriction protein B